VTTRLEKKLASRVDQQCDFFSLTPLLLVDLKDKVKISINTIQNNIKQSWLCYSAVTLPYRRSAGESIPNINGTNASWAFLVRLLNDIMLKFNTVEMWAVINRYKRLITSLLQYCLLLT